MNPLNQCVAFLLKEAMHHHHTHPHEVSCSSDLVRFLIDSILYNCYTLQLPKDNQMGFTFIDARVDASIYASIILRHLLIFNLILIMISKVCGSEENRLSVLLQIRYTHYSIFTLVYTLHVD